MDWERRGGLQMALLPLAGLHALGWLGFQGLFRSGLRKRARSALPAICVGNLIAGGSGKTPAALFVCDLLYEMGWRPVLSMSGYGGPAYWSPAMAPSGSLRAADWGDEPAMARWLRPHLPLVIGKDRVSAARIAAREGAASVLVLDDGFQHLPLIKDISIVLDPPDLENRWMIPAGPYREPRGSGLAPADLVLPGRFGLTERPLRFADPSGRAVPAPKAAAALCSVARPHRFLAALEEAGVKAEPAFSYPDHDPLTEPGLWKGIPDGLPVVVTAKDWVKLRERKDAAGRRVIIALREVEIEPREAFRDWLAARMREALR
jgi:tetraacyldisaccharide 4'-kinase